jgi:hypothetical protein
MYAEKVSGDMPSTPRFNIAAGILGATVSGIIVFSLGRLLDSHRGSMPEIVVVVISMAGGAALLHYLFSQDSRKADPFTGVPPQTNPSTDPFFEPEAAPSGSAFNGDSEEEEIKRLEDKQSDLLRHLNNYKKNVKTISLEMQRARQEKEKIEQDTERKVLLIEKNLMDLQKNQNRLLEIVQRITQEYLEVGKQLINKKSEHHETFIEETRRASPPGTPKRRDSFKSSYAF